MARKSNNTNQQQRAGTRNARRAIRFNPNDAPSTARTSMNKQQQSAQLRARKHIKFHPESTFTKSVIHPPPRSQNAKYWFREIERKIDVPVMFSLRPGKAIKLEIEEELCITGIEACSVALPKPDSKKKRSGIKAERLNSQVLPDVNNEANDSSSSSDSDDSSSGSDVSQASTEDWQIADDNNNNNNNNNQSGDASSSSGTVSLEVKSMADQWHREFIANGFAGFNQPNKNSLGLVAPFSQGTQQQRQQIAAKGGDSSVKKEQNNKKIKAPWFCLGTTTAGVSGGFTKINTELTQGIYHIRMRQSDPQQLDQNEQRPHYFLKLCGKAQMTMNGLA